MKSKVRNFRKWVVDRVLAPLAWRIMPFDAWDVPNALLMSGYFWIVMIKRRANLANESPSSYQMTALQFSHDDIVQVWNMGAYTLDNVETFVHKLRATQGVNNVCVLKTTVDFDVIRKAIDSIMPPAV